jgi:hypothetical protein
LSFTQVSEKKRGKIEVFQRVGRCHFDLAGAANIQEVRVVCSDGGGEDFPVKVAVGGALETVTKKKKEKRNNLRDGAKEYLVNHQLEVTLSDAVAEVLKERPSDPLVALSNYLLEVHTARNPKPPPAPATVPPPHRSLAPMVPTAPPPRSPEQQVKALKRPSKERKLAPISQKSATILGDASVPKAAEEPKVSKISTHEKAKDLLMTAEQDGSLCRVLAEHTKPPQETRGSATSRGVIKRLARSLLMNAEQGGSLGDILQQTLRQEEKKSSKERASSVLMTAQQVGKLETAIREAKGVPKKPSSLKDPQARARDVLIKGAETGLLSRRGSKERASSVLMTAQQVGTLDTAIKKAIVPQEVPQPAKDRVKEKAAAVLYDSIANGSLDGVLANAMVSGKTGSKERASSVLMTAQQAGSLDTAIREALVPKVPNTKRERVGSILVGAAKNGKLRPSIKASLTKGVSGQGKAKMLLLASLEDGSLDEAIKSI